MRVEIAKYPTGKYPTGNYKVRNIEYFCTPIIILKFKTVIFVSWCRRTGKNILVLSVQVVVTPVWQGRGILVCSIKYKHAGSIIGSTVQIQLLKTICNNSNTDVEQ